MVLVGLYVQNLVLVGLSRQRTDLSIEFGFCEAPGKEVRYSNPGALRVVFSPACKLLRYGSGVRVPANQRNMCFILMTLCVGIPSQAGWPRCMAAIESDSTVLQIE